MYHGSESRDLEVILKILREMMKGSSLKIDIGFPVPLLPDNAHTALQQYGKEFPKCNCWHYWGKRYDGKPARPEPIPNHLLGKNMYHKEALITKCLYWGVCLLYIVGVLPLKNRCFTLCHSLETALVPLFEITSLPSYSVKSIATEYSDQKKKDALMVALAETYVFYSTEVMRVPQEKVLCPCLSFLSKNAKLDTTEFIYVDKVLVMFLIENKKNLQLKNYLEMLFKIYDDNELEKQRIALLKDVLDYCLLGRAIPETMSGSSSTMTAFEKLAVVVLAHCEIDSNETAHAQILLVLIKSDMITYRQEYSSDIRAMAEEMTPATIADPNLPM